MADETIVRLAHVAGLTAGKTMPLAAGTYEFGPNEADDDGLGVGEPSSVSFSLEVRPSGEIVLIPGNLPVSLESQRVSSPINIVSGQTIQAGADHFVMLPAVDSSAQNRRTIAPSTPIAIKSVAAAAPRRGSMVLLLALILIVAGVALGFFIDELWYLLAGLGIVIGVAQWLRRGRAARLEQARQNNEARDAKAELANDLMARRFDVAQERRSEILSPAEMLSNQPLSSAAALALGAGDTEWAPRLGRTEGLGWDPNPTIADYSSLSSVPYTIDPAAGPVALAGERSDTRATARYLSVAAMHYFGPDQVSLSTDNDNAWSWADSRIQRGSTGFVIVDQSTANLKSPARGIVLIDTDAPLPTGIDRVLRITSSSLAHVVDDEAKLLAADLVPYGLTASAASSAASAVLQQHETDAAMRSAAAQRLKNANRPVPTPPVPSAVPLPATPPMPKTAIGDETQLATDPSAAIAADGIAASGIAAPVKPATANSTAAAIDHSIDADGGDPQRLDSESNYSEGVLDSEGLDSGRAASRLTSPTDLSPGNATVLFTVDSPETGRELVASVAIDMAHRRHSSELAIGVIDSAERGLIRLRQLPHCVGYAAIDDRAGIDRVLELVEAHTDGIRAPGETDSMVLVISDLPPLLDFLRKTGRGVAADRLVRAASSTDDQNLIVTAAASAGTPIDPDFDACVTSRVRHESTGSTRISDGRGERPLPTTDFSAHDLTAAVAEIKRSALQPTS